MLSGAIKDGFGITVTFSTSTAVSFEIDPTSITPPGIDGGDMIDTTTHSNSAVRTKHPRSLKEITDGSMTVAFDGDVWDDIFSAINTNQLITFTFPDGDTVAFWGYLRSFTPSEFVEGEQPSAEITIVVTNENDSGNETSPAWTSGS